MILLNLVLLLAISVLITSQYVEETVEYVYPDYGGNYGGMPPPGYGYGGGYGGYARAPGLVSNILYSLGLKKK
ncbi:hypothetical protein PENTCL1PPCAC_23700, partial [Pristionchus entomophagus]